MSATRIRACRRIQLYVTLALFAVSRFADPAVAAPPPSLPGRPLRAQDWDLAWQAFVGAGAIDDAYSLAQRAVAARPRSHLWLGRLAQAARWSNHPQTALAALSRLALDLHRRADLQPALALAIGLGNDDRAAALLRELVRDGRATEAQRRMLSGLYLENGEPRRAIRELQRQFARRPEPQLLWEQAVIYRTLGDPGRELATLQRYRRRFGPGSRVMLAIATLDYVHDRLPEALDALLAAQSRARPSDTAYWQALSGLAWLLGRYPVAARAAKVLIGTDKADASVYLRVVYVERYRRPREAFRVAERGWKQTQEPALFLALLGVAASLHPPTPWLARAFALLRPREASAFADAPSYWTGLAQLLAGEGRIRAARGAYRRALRANPGDDDLLADYLWLLIDDRDLAPIVPKLQRLARHARGAPQLWGPLAAVYVALHQPERALPWLQAQWPTHESDPLWLIDYADALQEADRPQAAWQLRRRAYDLLARRVRSAPGAREDESRLLALARLSMSLAPGDPARRAVARLARQPGERQARITVLAWMQSEHAYLLASWWRRRAFRREPPPDWATLAQAVARNDGPTIARLLGKRQSQLPPRDAVDAAADLGWNSLALSRAFAGLELAPRDTSLQRQFVELAVPRADSAGASATATETSGLLREGASAQASHWLSPANALEIRIDTTRQSSTDSGEFGTPPSLSRFALFDLRHLTALGDLTLDLGAGRDLANWTREGLSWQRRWSGSLQTTVAATAGAQPLDTPALIVAGLEDRLDASANARLTPRAALRVDLQAGRLRVQGGGALGAVERFSLGGDYRLWLSPPDFTLDASLSGAHYAPATRLPAQVSPLEPMDQAPTMDFLIPASFVQACAGGHFNMQFATTYTVRLRPYASADVCANSVSGPGYDLTAGLAAPVLGPDHLSLTVNLANNVGAHSGRTAGAMLRYGHYFTPTQ